MYTVRSTYSPYLPGYRLHPEGRSWATAAGGPHFADYAAAHASVRHYLLTELGWHPLAGAEADERGPIAPEGHDQAWFTFGDTGVLADGEHIELTPETAG
ncbi:MAG TPA: hypothetical protein VF629_02960 [Hymenobacter sp.]|jgi:hypothetical protein|uniref:hypothetical protein n=1 Tax=Hymenobacter sp. TaxID=1898978 RepID=UPI002ED875CE